MICNGKEILVKQDSGKTSNIFLNIIILSLSKWLLNTDKTLSTHIFNLVSISISTQRLRR